MSIYILYDRCKTLFTPPLNLMGNNSIDEEKIYEALSPLYEALNNDDSIEGFVKWIMLPMVVVFGTTIVSDEGQELINGQQEKLRVLSNVYSAEKATYLTQKEIVDLTDPWDFIKFANHDISEVGRAFINAFKYKKVKL